MIELYKNIKRLREEKGMSQDTLAKLTGYTDRSSIAKIEKGLVDLQQSKISLFATALGTTSRELMGRDDNSTAVPPPAPEHSIEKIIDATKEQLLTQDGLTLEGRPACPESIDSVLTSMTIGVEMAKQKNRKIPEPKELTRTQKVPAVPDYMKAEAAHLRTDIEVTPEQIQADDDIMNDDSEWT